MDKLSRKDLNTALKIYPFNPEAAARTLAIAIRSAPTNKTLDELMQAARESGIANHFSYANGLPAN